MSEKQNHEKKSFIFRKTRFSHANLKRKRFYLLPQESPRYDETSTCFVCCFCIRTEDLILDSESIDTIFLDEHSFRLTSFRFFTRVLNKIEMEDDCEFSKFARMPSNVSRHFNLFSTLLQRCKHPLMMENQLQLEGSRKQNCAQSRAGNKVLILCAS